MPKHKQRLRFLTARKSMPAEVCQLLGQSIQQRFLQSAAFHGADCLALYSAVNNEVCTTEVARRALDSGKRLVYPKVRGETLEFIVIRTLEDLKPGYLGVLEPIGPELVLPGDIDVLVVPGVAFALNGYRLGYGRGYYDRTLAACRRDCLKVGFAYEMQLAEFLPIEIHDEALSVLMTESRTINCTVGAALAELRP